MNAKHSQLTLLNIMWKFDFQISGKFSAIFRISFFFSSFLTFEEGNLGLDENNNSLKFKQNIIL
jgi:hypothetical protein